MAIERTSYFCQVLHGEQYTEVYKPLPTTATLTSKTRIVDILDKGSGAVMIVNGNIHVQIGLVIKKKPSNLQNKSIHNVVC
jgi:hypothetical protein